MASSPDLSIAESLVSEEAKSAQLAIDEARTAPRSCAVFATEPEALACCAKIDAALGYPRIDIADDGKTEVLTTGYTLPVPLDDGTYAVQMDAPLAATMKAGVAPRDLLALAKREAEAIEAEPVKAQTKAVNR